jgi:hypothetical protein
MLGESFGAQLHFGRKSKSHGEMYVMARGSQSFPLSRQHNRDMRWIPVFPSKNEVLGCPEEKRGGISTF